MVKFDKYALTPKFEGRKSYYGKAVVNVEIDGESVVKNLKSYETCVMRVENGKLLRRQNQPCSATTARHMREFAQQEGFGWMSKAQMLDLPTFAY